jgi:hypothetical protein
MSVNSEDMLRGGCNTVSLLLGLLIIVQQFLHLLLEEIHSCGISVVADLNSYLTMR